MPREPSGVQTLPCEERNQLERGQQSSSPYSKHRGVLQSQGQGAARPQEGGEPDPPVLSQGSAHCPPWLSAQVITTPGPMSQAQPQGDLASSPSPTQRWWQSREDRSQELKALLQAPSRAGQLHQLPCDQSPRGPEAGRRREPGKSVLAQAALRWVSVPGREGAFCFPGATLSGVEEGGEGTGRDQRALVMGKVGVGLGWAASTPAPPPTPAPFPPPPAPRLPSQGHSCGRSWEENSDARATGGTASAPERW